MITTGKKNDVLERTEVEKQTNVLSDDYSMPTSTYTGSSVSNDLLTNYAQKGIRFEESLTEETFTETARYTTENTDVTPSATTMQFTYENDDFEEDEVQDTQRSYKISPRGKIMITVYALVIATIIALIAMNAKVIKSMERSIQEKEQAVASLAMQTQALSQELSYVSSEEVISQKAIELGMSK